MQEPAAFGGPRPPSALAEGDPLTPDDSGIVGSMADSVRARVEEAAASPGFEAYQEVRRQVLAMRDREQRKAGSVDAPSAYWREELEQFDYMLDAHPLVVAKLRRHCYHITGLRAYDYRSHKASTRLARRKKDLERVGGRELLIPEPELLGGFGFQLDGGLYNLDTLKYSEALIALQRGAVLDDIRSPGRSPVIWEIGSGWGGFAYQLKTVCPEATILLSDFPELFLFSATYLMTAFPSAHVLFEGSSDDPGPGRWTDFDFVFVSNARTDAIRPPRLDLTVNMVSFQEMTTDQAESYVSHAAEVGCPVIYSLNRERSLYNPELSGVTAIISRHYEPQEVRVLSDSYVAAGKTGRFRLRKSARSLVARLLSRLPLRREAPKEPSAGANNYRHLLGRLRTRD
jgi:putative sugar O-methyltransferase